MMINDLLAIKQGSTDYKNVNLKALIKNTILVKIGLHCRYKRRGQAGVSSRVHKQQFCISRVTKQIVNLISAMCLRDLCMAINSLA